MQFAPELLQDAQERHTRFELPFRAQYELGDIINRVLTEERARLLQTPDGSEPDFLLSRFVQQSLAKAMKTFLAVQRLCLFGFGQEATLLIRSNINLYINLSFILAADAPIERAKDLDAYSRTQMARLVEAVRPGSSSSHDAPYPPLELKERANRWSRTGIGERAKRAAGAQHYPAYMFYSSIDHSDTISLSAYLIEETDQTPPRLMSGPDDSHVRLALNHNLAVMADVLECVCQCHSIDRSDLFDRVRSIFAGLERESGAESS